MISSATAPSTEVPFSSGKHQAALVKQEVKAAYAPGDASIGGSTASKRNNFAQLKDDEVRLKYQCEVKSSKSSPFNFIDWNRS